MKCHGWLLFPFSFSELFFCGKRRVGEQRKKASFSPLFLDKSGPIFRSVTSPLFLLRAAGSIKKLYLPKKEGEETIKSSFPKSTQFSVKFFHRCCLYTCKKEEEVEGLLNKKSRQTHFNSPQRIEEDTSRTYQLALSCT